MTRWLLAGILAVVVAGESRVAEKTVVRGRIVSAVEGRPVAGAKVISPYDSVLTDETGAYEMRVNRGESWLVVEKAGFLDFQYPLLVLATDTLVANVELRTDPPSPASYVGGGFLPLLCIRMDDPGRLDVTHSCQWPTRPKEAYYTRIIKHNPWNPYFGRAGDRGGVLIATPR